MRSGSIYVFKKEIILLCFSSDKDTWIWKATKPFYRLCKVFDEDLAMKIRDVLSRSQEKIEFEPEYSPNKEIEQSIGLKYNQLQGSQVDCVELIEVQDIIDFLPTKNLGKNKGFSHLNSRKVSVSVKATNEDVLKALKEALTHCER